VVRTATVGGGPGLRWPDRARRPPGVPSHVYRFPRWLPPRGTARGPSKSTRMTAACCNWQLGLRESGPICRCKASAASRVQLAPIAGCGRATGRHVSRTRRARGEPGGRPRASASAWRGGASGFSARETGPTWCPVRDHDARGGRVGPCDCEEIKS
jgi:hypothetical protein